MIDLLFDWFGISCMISDNICFYLRNRLIQTSQKGGQQYSDTSPFSIPCLYPTLPGKQICAAIHCTHTQKYICEYTKMSKIHKNHFLY